MKKNVKFKGLLNYTVSCISELVTPPNPNVRDNAHALKNCGGIKILVEALKNHGNDEELLALVSRTLEKCGCDSNMIARLASDGAAMAVLTPLDAHPYYTDGRVAAVSLVRKVCCHAIFARFVFYSCMSIFCWLSSCPWYKNKHAC